MLQIASSDGVIVAVHEFGGPDGAAPLVISHANGFHAHCYLPIAERLSSHFRVFALDHRGHGSTEAPEGWNVDWRRFGDDCLAVCEAIAPEGRLVGLGHSMGGAALLMAAHRNPSLFDRLVLFEPIAIPPEAATIEMEAHPLVTGARRRRRQFGSMEEAVENFQRKPPMSLMRDDVLRAYVEHGFRSVNGPDGERLELICSADVEAGTFLSGHLSGLWHLLPEIEVPTDVIRGFVAEDEPSSRCDAIASLLPVGRSLAWDHQSHLGPFSHPDELVEHVVATCR